MSRSRPLSPSQERARQVFRALRGVLQLKNGEIARRGGVARGYIESKSCGATAIDLEDIEILARAFAVDEHVFLMDPISAQRWVLDHAIPRSGEGSDQVSGWNSWSKQRKIEPTRQRRHLRIA